MMCFRGTMLTANFRDQQTYRLWVVWGRAWWIIIVPIVLIIGTGGAL